MPPAATKERSGEQALPNGETIVAFVEFITWHIKGRKPETCDDRFRILLGGCISLKPYIVTSFLTRIPGVDVESHWPL